MTAAPDVDGLAAEFEAPVRRGLSMAELCTYRVGGPADLVVTVSSIDEFQSLSEEIRRVRAGGSGCPVLVVGKGSNLLVSQQGFPGIVILLGETFAAVDIDPASCRVHAGAAALLPVVARRTAAAGLRGFEWAVGVPGSIGGAVRMNAGGHGSDMAASLIAVELFDLHRGERLAVGADELDLGYRHSAIQAHQVVLSADLGLDPGDSARSQQEISEIVQWRRANQPGGQNAGSVFANPEGDSAGRIIDSLGLKGFRIGSAQVSTKHANFIQADPGGSADDVRSVMDAVRNRVEEQTGIVLRIENHLVGFDSDMPDRPIDGATGD